MVIRRAGDVDMPSIFALYGELAGAYSHAESDELQQQESLWQEVASDSRQTILVAEEAKVIIGTLTLIIVPNLGHHGQPWAAIENVVVAGNVRGKGIGKALMTEATRIAKEKNCYKIVLSTNLVRVEAHEFYRQLGWKQSHIGFSLELN